jgi:hypothetical protein
MKQEKLDTEEKSAISRSPRSPIFSLPKALEKAKMLYDTHKKNYVAVPVALLATGHKSGSSKGLQTLAALGYYGLVDTMGLGSEKKIKVSDLAFKIFMDQRPNSPERDQAIYKAALTPKMFKAIYEKYPEDLPGDDALHYELTVDYGFNENSVADFVKVFKETITFAKVYKSDIIKEGIEENEELAMPQEENKMDSTNNKQNSMSIVGEFKKPILKMNVHTEDLLAQFPSRPKLSFRILTIKDNTEVTQADIDQLIDYLKLYKKGFPSDETTINKLNES